MIASGDIDTPNIRLIALSLTFHSLLMKLLAALQLPNKQNVISKSWP